MTDIEQKLPSRDIHPLVVTLIGPKAPATILFVDDDDLILRAFARDMYNSDVSISLARSGREGLDAIAKQNFSIVIADFPGACFDAGRGNLQAI